MAANAHQPPNHARLHQHALFISLSALCALLVAVTSLGIAHDDKVRAVLPIAILLTAALAALAITRFAPFVVLMLAVRASIDLSKLDPSGPSATQSTAQASRYLTPSTLLAGLFIVAATIWLIAQVRAGTLTRWSPLARCWGFFAFAAFVSLFGSADPIFTLVGAAQVLAIVLMYLVAEQLMSRGRTRNHLLIAVYVSAIFPLLYTVAGFLLGEPAAQEKDGVLRLVGTFTQTNVYARYLMLIILFGIAILHHLPKRWAIPLGGILLTSSIFLILTYTLTAIVGTIIGILVLALWHKRRLFVPLVMAVACSLAFAPQLVDRVQNVTTPQGSTVYAQSSLSWRLSYWPEILPLAKDNPTTGIGLNMTTEELDENRKPHNDFLRAYVEEGLVGAVAFLLLVVTLVGTGIRACRASPRGSLDRSIAMGFLACSIAVVVSSAVDNVFASVAVLWYLVIFAAAAANIARSRHLPQSLVTKSQ